MIVIAGCERDAEFPELGSPQMPVMSVRVVVAASLGAGDSPISSDTILDTRDA